jgi:sulfite exporter TauE/SafE
MELASVHSPAAAFLAGLVTSLHCAGMCGPLACAVIPVRREQGEAMAAACSYHFGRLAAYGALGAVAGGMGAVPLRWVSGGVLRWLPWLGVVFFVGLALRWDRFWPKPRLLSVAFGAFTRRLRRFPAVLAPAALGLATPLLPCGPLYFLVALALLAGSAAGGAELMLAFGLGTVPLLWLAQTQFGRLQAHLSPQSIRRLRVGLSLAAAVVAAWRLRGTFLGGGAGAPSYLCF